MAGPAEQWARSKKCGRPIRLCSGSMALLPTRLWPPPDSGARLYRLRKNPAFLTGTRRVWDKREKDVAKGRLFRHNYVIETKSMRWKETAFAYRVYSSCVRVCSSFFAPGGGGVLRGADCERRRLAVVARGGPQDQAARPRGRLLHGRPRASCLYSNVYRRRLNFSISISLSRLQPLARRDVFRGQAHGAGRSSRRARTIGISDLSGTTGMAILDAILAGERDPRKLALLRDGPIQVPRRSPSRRWGTTDGSICLRSASR